MRKTQEFSKDCFTIICAATDFIIKIQTKCTNNFFVCHFYKLVNKTRTRRPCILLLQPVSQTHLFTSFQTPPPILHMQTSPHKGPLPSSLVASPAIGDSVRNMLLVSLDTHCFQLHTQGSAQTVGSFSVWPAVEAGCSRLLQSERLIASKKSTTRFHQTQVRCADYELRRQLKRENN